MLSNKRLSANGSIRILQSLVVCVACGAVLFLFTACSGCGPTDRGGVEGSDLVLDYKSVTYARGFCFAQDGEGRRNLLILSSSAEPTDGSDALKGDDAAAVTSLRKGGPFERASLRYVMGDSLYVSDTLVVFPGSVRRIVAMSTTHLPMLDVVGVSDRLVGVSGSQYVSDTCVRGRVERGEVIDVGMDAQLNYEVLLSLKPDIVLAYAVPGTANPVLDRIRGAGIPVLMVGEFLESHPLARAEWVKAIGFVAGTDSTAFTFFEGVASRYEGIRARVDWSGTSPSVLFNVPWKESWWVPGSTGFLCRLLEDAGGHCPSAEGIAGSASATVNYERMLEYGMTADFWFHPGVMGSVEEVKALDGAFGQFPSVMEGRVYNNTARMGVGGGNDFFERGVVEPDVILRDMATILGTLPGSSPDSLVYYIHLQ